MKIPKDVKDYLLMLLVVVLFIAGSTITYHEEVAPYEEAAPFNYKN